MSKFIRNDSLTALNIECTDCGAGLSGPAASPFVKSMIDAFPANHICLKGDRK